MKTRYFFQFLILFSISSTLYCQNNIESKKIKLVEMKGGATDSTFKSLINKKCNKWLKFEKYNLDELLTEKYEQSWDLTGDCNYKSEIFYEYQDNKLFKATEYGYRKGGRKKISETRFVKNKKFEKEIISFFFDKVEKDIKVIERELDEKGRPIKESFYYDNELQSETTYFYEKDLLVKKEKRGYSGKISSIHEYKYYESGELFMEFETDYNWPREILTRYKYVGGKLKAKAQTRRQPRGTFYERFIYRHTYF